MRLGGPIFTQTESPEAWTQAVLATSYKAAYCPISTDADSATIKAYCQAAKKADITIAEVGAWSNPLSPNIKTAEEALNKCKASLELADKIGARCCVNISGSRGDIWDGPDPANFADET
ncbi:MAG: sugar phosphate isomerase/epimerase, partial [Chloroflexota bacterium]